MVIAVLFMAFDGASRPVHASTTATHSNASSDRAKSNEEEPPPDYFRELTDKETCIERPHVIIPRSGGKAAGKCATVEAFTALYTVSSDGAGPKVTCGVRPGGCSSETVDAGQGGSVESALGTQYGFVWGGYQLAVNIAAWFTGWGISFTLFDAIGGFAEKLRAAWDERVIRDVDLGGFGGFILVLAVLWAGMLMLFHRFRRGFAELMISVLLAVIAATFILHPGQTIKSTMDSARFFGLTVASITLKPGATAERNPTSLEEANRRADKEVNKAVANKFVQNVLVKPHMIANTGKIQTGKCERYYWEMVGSSGKARDAAFEKLIAEGSGGNGQPCASESAREPTIQRILIAMLLLVMAVVIGAFCLLSVGLLLLSQVAAAAYLAVSAVVAALAPLPGWGRSLLVKWITGLLVAVAGIIASVVVVVVYLNVLGLILGMGESPLANFALALLVVIAGFKLRKRLTSGLRRGARQIGAKLEGTLQRPGGETLVEREQRRHTSTSHLRTATAVAAGAAGGTLAGNAMASRRDPALPGGGAGNGTTGPVGFGSRVRNAMSQTKHGRLAVDTTSAVGRSPVGGAATAASGFAVGGVTRGSVAAARTVEKVKGDVTDAVTPAGPAASERATRAASRVADGSSDRAKDLIAEMQRRQQERAQELARRRQQ